MRAVITVIGKDMVGILAKVSTACAQHNINVLEVTQSILQDMFAMIMMVDISSATKELAVLAQECSELGKQIGMAIYMQHEDIFNAMHNV